MDNGCLDFEAKLAKVAQKSRVDFQKTLAAAVLARLEDEAKEAAIPGTRKKAKGKWRKYDDEGLSDLIRKTVSETPAAYTAAKQLLCEFPLQPLKSTEMLWAREREADANALHRAEAKEGRDGDDPGGRPDGGPDDSDGDETRRDESDGDETRRSRDESDAAPRGAAAGGTAAARRAESPARRAAFSVPDPRRPTPLTISASASKRQCPAGDEKTDANELMSRLFAWRMSKAKELNKLGYLINDIISEEHIHNISVAMPRTASELAALLVNAYPKAKLERYGPALVREVNAFLDGAPPTICIDDDDGDDSLDEPDAGGAGLAPRPARAGEPPPAGNGAFAPRSVVATAPRIFFTGGGAALRPAPVPRAPAGGAALRPAPAPRAPAGAGRGGLEGAVDAGFYEEEVDDYCAARGRGLAVGGGDGSSPLTRAVRSGDLRAVRALLRAGAVASTPEEEDFLEDDAVRRDIQTRAAASRRRP
ncbi:hypothetical protein M885DRAFT_588314 [Pelagophyceae sp. CCMP2097]|nr:hypothetical protein M885DRAFT_588314 [Pelagophyceae sp. CCMP2097]